MYPKSVYCCQKVSINPCLLIPAFCYIGCSYKRIYFRESIRKIAVVYLKPSGTSKIELFQKIVNDCYFRCSTGFWIVWYFKGNKAKQQGVSWGKKRSFFGKFGVLCFLGTTVLGLALLPYYWRLGSLVSETNHGEKQNKPSGKKCQPVKKQKIKTRKDISGWNS